MSPETNQTGFKILNGQTHDNFDCETNRETNQISPETCGIDGETNELYHRDLICLLTYIRDDADARPLEVARMDTGSDRKLGRPHNELRKTTELMYTNCCTFFG
jgi:hypothetical protein